MSISIGDNYLYAMNTENSKSTAKANKLQNQLTGVNSESTDEELMEACKTFESYLAEKMITAMKKTVPKDEEESDYEKYFNDMLYQEYAQQITENSELGIAQQLYEAMKRNNQGL